MGDSKTVPLSNSWNSSLLTRQTGWVVTDVSDTGPTNTVAHWSANIATYLAAIPSNKPPVYFLVNIGTHDLIGGIGSLNEATWEGQYESALDAIHAAWPNAKVLLTKQWRQGQDADSDTLAGWMQTVINARSTFTYAGDDERIWFKPNVATYSADGTHYYTVQGESAATTVKQQAIEAHP